MEPAKPKQEEKAIKFFVGGVSHDTDEQTLRDYFSKYGEVRSSEIIRDRITGLGRGFGFIVFADNSVVDQVLQDDHVILGKKVEVKVARPKGYREPFWKGQQQSTEIGEASNSGKNRKIFVGGIPADLTMEELKTHFENYGSVTDAEIRHPRGFAFVTFDSEEAVESALKTTFQCLKNKWVEVKVAEAKTNFGFSVSNAMRDSTSSSSSVGSSIFPATGAYVPYPYGFMPGWYYYGTTMNGWQNGFSYSGPWISTGFSHYNHDHQGNILAGDSQHRKSRRIIIRLPPEKVEGQNGNASKEHLAKESQLENADVEDGQVDQEDGKKRTNGHEVHEEDGKKRANGEMHDADGMKRTNSEVDEEDGKKRPNGELHEEDVHKRTNGEVQTQNGAEVDIPSKEAQGSSVAAAQNGKDGNLGG